MFPLYCQGGPIRLRDEEENVTGCGTDSEFPFLAQQQPTTVTPVVAAPPAAVLVVVVLNSEVAGRHRARAL